MAGVPPPSAAPPRLWLLRGGFWYFLWPILSVGVLSAVPFFHAAYRLRDRKVLAWAGLYAAGGAAAGVLLPSVSWTRDPDLATYVAALPAGAVFAFQIAVAVVHLSVLRRRIFLGVAVGAFDEPALLTEVEASNPTERRFRLVLVWARELLAAALVVAVCLVIPVGAVAQTFSGQGNLAVGNGQVQTVLVVAIALAGAAWLLAWLVLGYRRDDPVAVHAVFLGAAVVVNVYVGFALWVAAVRLIGIEPAVTHPQQFGGMVWWNLIDSVPVLDVDSALDWERPMEDYGPGIGWLFLAQRLVLLLTLARAIQVLVNHWSTPPSSRRPPADGGATAHPPDWEPLAILASLFRRSPRWMGGQGAGPRPPG